MTLSKLALSTVLAAGIAGAFVAAPADAQRGRRDKEGQGNANANAAANAGPQLKLSDPFRKAFAPAQAAAVAKDMATATARLNEAAAIAKTDDENYAVNALRLQIAASSNDNATMLPALDALVKNPKTPAAQLPQYNYFRGALPFQQKKYAEALPFLQKARELGYQNENLNLQIAVAMMESGNNAGGIAELEKAIAAEQAAGRKAPESWYSVAVGKLYTAKDPKLVEWLNKRVVAYPTAKNWREAILTYREQHEGKGAAPLDRGQQIDLFRLLRATKSLANRGDYIEYADLAYQAGLPGESKTIINEGRATGKIPATDATANRLLADAERQIAAEGSLAGVEAKARTAANGKTAAQTADAYLALGQYAKAIELYQVALQKGGVDASEVNMHLGVAQTQAGQKDAAKTAFQAVTTNPRKEMASFWLTWLDTGTTAGSTAAGQ